MSKAPGELKLSEDDQRKLYDLIWKRTIASQMEAARLERTTITVASRDGEVELRATGQVILFDGFLKVYEEGRDDVAEDEDDKRLPQVASGDALKLAGDALKPDHAKLVEGGGKGILSDNGGVLGQQHFTQPPPRYTEATLVKRMEELGIGRPSTYASILDTIQARGYVTQGQGPTVPRGQGAAGDGLPRQLFPPLPRIRLYRHARGRARRRLGRRKHYKDVLERFWKDFSAAVARPRSCASPTCWRRSTRCWSRTCSRRTPRVRTLGSAPIAATGGFPCAPRAPAGRSSAARTIPNAAIPAPSARPGWRATAPRTGWAPDGKMLGVDPDSSQAVWLKTGRFGPYVQLGDVTEEVPKPPRASLPKGWEVAEMDLEKALMLLSLPRKVGDHPEDGEPVEAGIGRYGPYVKHGRIYANLPEVDEVFTVGMNRAVELIAAKAAGRAGRGAAAAPLKELGEHPGEGGPVNVMSGRYGPYVKWGKVNATLPKDLDPQDVTLERAVELIAEKQAKGGKGKRAGGAAKKKKAS
jgi:DNA topoisomerase-1